MYRSQRIQRNLNDSTSKPRACKIHNQHQNAKIIIQASYKSKFWPFFYRQKREYIKSVKRTSAPEYAGHPEQAPRGKAKKRKNKNYSIPQQKPNQSTKSIKGRMPSSMCTLSQRKISSRQVLLRLWSDISSFSNDLQLLSFQIVQKMYKGAALHSLLSPSSHKRAMPP